MMPSDFIKLDGTRQQFDLDTVFRIVRGYSQQRENWSSSVVYAPELNALIEVRSSPQDFKGNSADEAQEVTSDYLSEAYGIDKKDFADFLLDPKGWNLVNQR